MADIQNQIFDIIADKGHVDRDKITPEATMADLGVESLDIVEIVFALEDKFNIEIPYNANQQDAAGFSTVADVVDAVNGLIEKKRG